MGLFDIFKRKKNIPEKSVVEPIVIVKQTEDKQHNTKTQQSAEAGYKKYEDYYEYHKCPYCEWDFDKEVSRKRKCPNCQGTVVVRTNFLSKKKLLLKEELVEDFEKNKAAYFVEQWKENNDSRKDEWAIKKATSLGIEPAVMEQKKVEGYSMYDLIWGALNKKQMEYASKFQWGLYRNSLVDMAEMLEREGKEKEAYLFYLRVCFHDLNGPQNSYVGAEKSYDPVEFGFLAPGIVIRVEDWIKKDNLHIDEVKEDFLLESNRIKNKLMPLSPEQAWVKLSKEISS